jgi:orotate phosphoribosyltransferase
MWKHTVTTGSMLEVPRTSDLFQAGNFTLHSGEEATWKIEADSLSKEEIKLFARLIAEKVAFRDVYGVPQGGLRLAKRLRRYRRTDPALPVLLVDDVLTTGTSMEQMKEQFEGIPIVGIVLFARNPPPSWIKAVFQFWSP